MPVFLFRQMYNKPWTKLPKADIRRNNGGGTSVGPVPFVGIKHFHALPVVFFQKFQQCLNAAFFGHAVPKRTNAHTPINDLPFLMVALRGKPIFNATKPTGGSFLAAAFWHCFGWVPQQPQCLNLGSRIKSIAQQKKIGRRRDRITRRVQERAGTTKEPDRTKPDFHAFGSGVGARVPGRKQHHGFKGVHVDVVGLKCGNECEITVVMPRFAALSIQSWWKKRCWC